MNLHEYQSKQLFRDYAIAVPDSCLLSTLDELDNCIEQLGQWPIVAKVQVHAGGRGKAGGVALCHDKEALKTFCHQHLGSRLVTHQTDQQGQPIEKILLEQGYAIEKEFYLGMVIDRSRQCVSMIASTEGGMDIEKVAAQSPEKIISLPIHALAGLMPYQVRELAFALELDIKQLYPIVSGLHRLFITKDLSLIEINPLVLTKDQRLICLDAKINIDDNALYRQKDLAALRDCAQEDARENEASQWQLNYVALNGNIGCMVNGAGLAMATMDIIKLHGGEPANFLDVGGGTTTERVAEAFKLILSDPGVAGILVNIFGGIVRCDLIAQGIISAIKQVSVNVPVVVRLEGNHAREGIALLQQSDLDLISASDLESAAEKIVQIVQQKHENQ